MQVIIESNSKIKLENVSELEREIIIQGMSVEIPNNHSTGFGEQREKRYMCKINKSSLRTAITFLPRIYKICVDNNLPITIHDARLPIPPYKLSPDHVTPDMLDGVTLTDYQIRSIKQAIASDFGILSIPTGGGKTEVAAALTKLILGNVVILGDMQVVVSQITERLKLRGAADDIGMFFAGEMPNGQSVVVGSVQSLIPPKPLGIMPVIGQYESEAEFNKAYTKWESRRKALNTRAVRQKELEGYIKRAQALIIDEVDTSGNDMFRDVIHNMFKGRIRYGLSGTPFDPLQPVNNFNIEENCGPIITKVSRSEVEAAGRIVPCRYIMLDYQPPGTTIHDASCYDIAENIFINDNPYFHGLVLSAMQLHRGEKNVILVKSISLGENLKKILEEDGFKVEYAHGATPMKMRNRMFKQFENDEIDILIGSKIIHRALDLSGGIDNLFIAVDTKLSKTLWQMIGRALRKNAKGYSTIYGVLFRCNKHLYKHSKSHLQQLVDSEYDCYVSFGHKLFSGAEFIARNFQPPRSPNTKPGGVEERFLFHK